MIVNKKIFPIIAIAGNVEIAKELSERFAGEKNYFAIMEEPWVSRPNAEHEVIRRNNLLALIPHKHLVIAGCNEKSYELMMNGSRRKYKKKVIEIKNGENIHERLKPILDGLKKPEQIPLIEKLVVIPAFQLNKERLEKLSPEDLPKVKELARKNTKGISGND